MNPRLLALVMAFAIAGTAAAQEPPPVAIPAPSEPNAIPIFGKDGMGSTTSENWGRYSYSRFVVRNVTRPSLTPFMPDPEKANGAAVIVAPGGAFVTLSMQDEGWKVAQALADRGIAAFVLKYRVRKTPADIMEAESAIDAILRGGSESSAEPAYKAPLEDALAALKLVRANAAEWKIDPSRVGMIGFSAGAMASLRAALSPEGPNFIGYIYGPQAAVTVPLSAPPMFNAIALDDEYFQSQGFPIVQSWLDAGKPVEVHGYQKGGHGFGLGRAETTSTLMLDQFVAWLSMQGFLRLASGN